MSHQDHIIKKALIDLDILRIQQLASTAERKQKIYKDPQGRTRIIKARPAKRGLLGMGESTIWEKVKRGEFPKPIKISPRITCWKKSDIINWLESKQ
ncbi:AlpA family phage regulatory protein [Acinetobacter baumannii]|uniref:helix-turn-helix transcriptional regulator n=1 Tax=Acinetobacter baumannii TaxID=470 RepID=UPI000E1C9156|nr:AlpA family phage regulatory protein [Acinetobacter baumannii]MBD0530010.1 AlpA family phage regulatory protein [Acinetobacter baumannii]MCZ0665746.1 AlpA family phage regulatory protein [Acinetobacter baumannii]MCZ3264612.1 AlpA family phage regulatory protein [Acinetobacter baumannii]MDA3563926.1 AlpA family phage regulatory protein [Acinetobacter baumannii]MDA3582417.1 AlpA family phage regulatory protein [Acinetobacter baumannii]